MLPLTLLMLYYTMEMRSLVEILKELHTQEINLFAKGLWDILHNNPKMNMYDLEIAMRRSDLTTHLLAVPLKNYLPAYKSKHPSTTDDLEYALHLCWSKTDLFENLNRLKIDYQENLSRLKETGFLVLKNSHSLN